MVIGRFNHTGQIVGNETLFLKRLKRLKCLKSSNLKKINHLRTLDDDKICLWTSYPMLYFLNAIGVAQFQLDEGRLSVKHSLCSRVYVSFLFILFVCCKTFLVITESKHLHLTTMGPLWISCLITGSNIIFSTHDSKILCLISGKLSKINEIMCKKLSKDHTTKGSIFIILETVVLACGIFYYDRPDLFKTAFLVFVKSHVAFVSIQLYEINLKLRDAFEEVNKNFEKVADRYGSGIFTVSSYLPFVETVGRIERNNLPTIPVLIDLHWALCKIVGMLGDYLGIKLMLVMAYSCLIVINVPYMIITIWLSSKDKEKLSMLARKALEIVMCIVEILFLIMPCVLTASEAKKTSKLVCALLNKHLPNSVRKQLEKTVQLLKFHNAELSAIGLFKIDLSVITSIAGVASTYLIIFVQHKSYSKIGEDINYLNNNNTQNYTQT